ncbi:MAG: hypothetical protein KAI24_10725, partial [Planctomycetes bacterium]|nr:hypothetical protein [Planctomycetota bacterium]
MIRPVLIHLFCLTVPAALATGLGWSALGTPGRVALAATLVGSVALTVWHTLRERRRQNDLRATEQGLAALTGNP